MSALSQLQHWMQSAITAESDVETSADAPVETLLATTPRLSPQASLNIYRNAYALRIRRSLRESLPLLRIALGDELFDGFAEEYLRLYPPRSYTLEELDQHFVDYLREQRPDAKMAEQREWWADLMIDLVRLDKLSRAVFHAASEPATTLATFGFPLARYARALHRGERFPFPQPLTTHLAIYRRDYVVRWRELSASEYEALLRGPASPQSGGIL